MKFGRLPSFLPEKGYHGDGSFEGEQWRLGAIVVVLVVLWVPAVDWSGDLDFISNFDLFGGAGGWASASCCPLHSGGFVAYWVRDR